MKRLAIFILMLCCLISLFSCVNSEIDIPEDTKLNIENNDENHWESNDSPDSVNTSIETEGKENEAIGGTHMGDDLYSPYNGYVDTIISAEDTRKYVIGAFEMLFTKREDRPAKKHGTV